MAISLWRQGRHDDSEANPSEEKTRHARRARSNNSAR
jgi:hypothetical protein